MLNRIRTAMSINCISTALATFKLQWGCLPEVHANENPRKDQQDRWQRLMHVHVHDMVMHYVYTRVYDLWIFVSHILLRTI